MRLREALYEDARTTIVEILGKAAASEPDVGATPVPACAEWSVHDVLAHLTGGCADALAGNIDGVATEAWTAAQVDARRGAPLEDVIAEWERLGPAFAALIDDLPGGWPDNVVADIAVHEHDIRGALGCPGNRRSEAVERSLDFLLTIRVHAGARALGLPPLKVHAGERSWIIGTGEPASGDAQAAMADAVFNPGPAATSTAEPVGAVSADPFELFRAVTGRRSALQIRGFDWTIDPSGHMALFAMWPFAL